MTNDKTDLDRVADVLSYDPLGALEDAGISYHDPANMGVTLGHFVHANEYKRKVLQEHGDTHHGMSYADGVALVLSLGFEEVFSKDFEYAKYGDSNTVTYKLFWRKGILLELESWGEGKSSSINSAKIYFNWRRHELNDTAWPDWRVGISGGWKRRTPRSEAPFDVNIPEDPYVLPAYVDVREGLRNALGLLEKDGYFLEEWYIKPWLHLNCYAEKDYDDNDHNKWKEWDDRVTAEKVAALPKHVQDAISAKGYYE